MDVAELVALYPDALKQSQREIEDLEKWNGPVARVQSYFEVRRRKLAELIDPDLVRDDLVGFLSALVGMGREWAPLADASDAELRQLLAIAMSLWRTKGAGPSWRSLGESQTGSAIWILDWFYFRVVEGSGPEVHTIPAPGASGAPYTNPERVTDIWYADPDAAIDVALLVKLLDRFRPVGERINLYRALHVDDMLGAGRWVNCGTGPARFDLAGRNYSVSEGGRYAVDLESAADWVDLHALLLLAVEGLVQVGIYETGAVQSTLSDGYRVDIDSDAHTVELLRVNGGVETSLEGPTHVPFIGGAQLRWTFEAWTGSSATTIKVWLEGTNVIDFDDTDGDRLEAGRVSFAAGPGAGAELTGTLIWSYPVTRTRIGPDP